MQTTAVATNMHTILCMLVQLHDVLVEAVVGVGTKTTHYATLIGMCRLMSSNICCNISFMVHYSLRDMLSVLMLFEVVSDVCCHHMACHLIMVLQGYSTWTTLSLCHSSLIVLPMSSTSALPAGRGLGHAYCCGCFAAWCLLMCFIHHLLWAYWRAWWTLQTQ